MEEVYFIGIDIGTQGARVILLSATGQQIMSKEAVFPLTENSREEQDPEMWWQCCVALLTALINNIQDRPIRKKIKGISVTSTSGTIIPIDNNYRPLHRAIMYSDGRSAAEAKKCKEIAERENVVGYTAFNSSSGLPKMCWFINNYPERVPKLYKFIHAADFIIGKLCGIYEITDYTNVLKSGYNLHQMEWPEYISRHLGIQPRWLQKVIPSGEPIEYLKTDVAEALGLPDNIVIAAGMTDGCASQVASGAVAPGQWNTTLGTTLVIKGVVKNEIIDPEGAIYNHRHPAGYWMPGGASNTGADWISTLFTGNDLAALNEAAAAVVPTGYLAWPLLQKGERFPFIAPGVKGFWPENVSKDIMFAAGMEGVAFIERYAFEKIASLSGEEINGIFSAGGGSNSELWLKIRSAVMNKPVYKMQNVSGAAGAAILAASRTYYASLQEAATKMVHPELQILPDEHWVKIYDEQYHRFINELKIKGIIS